MKKQEILILNPQIELQIGIIITIKFQFVLI